MRKIIYILPLAALLCYMLGFPKDAVRAAALGLSLWYGKMLPTLLPAAILSYILIHSGMLDSLAGVLHRFLRHIFPISRSGVYPLVAGMLFGFPLGSKITAELVKAGKMDADEGRRLFCACNNISPMFVSGFLLNDCLHRPDLRIPTYLILYAPPLALYMIQNRRRKFASPMGAPEKKAAPMSFQVIDAGIMNGFETLTKLGGYITLFAIFAQMMLLLPDASPILKCIVIGNIEITNGIAYTASQPLGFQTAYPLIMACTAFGGLSGFAQTASMVKDVGFPMLPYLGMKLLGSALTFLLAFLLVS